MTDPTERFDVLPSTQAEGLRRARGGAPPGTTLVARVQTEGRGRGRHPWSSPPGGLYLTRLVRLPSDAPTLLPMVVALGISEGLEHGFEVRTRLRWPNDLIEVGTGGKIGGVVADLVEAADGALGVVGVGLNVATARRELAARVDRPVAILAELLGRPVGPSELEATVVRAIDDAGTRLADLPHRRTTVRALRERLEGYGRRVRLDGWPAGAIVGLREDGALLTDDGTGPHAHLSGTLSYDGIGPEPPAAGSGLPGPAALPRGTAHR